MKIIQINCQLIFFREETREWKSLLYEFDLFKKMEVNGDNNLAVMINEIEKYNKIIFQLNLVN